MISSLQNPTIQRTRRLRKRAERVSRGAFIAEGHRAVRVALDNGRRVELVLYAPGARHKQLLVDAADSGAKIAEASRTVLGHLSSAANAPDVVAVVAMPAPSSAATGPVLVLAGVRDPAVAGAVLASAAASGVTHAVAVRGTADLYSSTVVRIAGGAHFLIGVSEAASVAEGAAGASRVVILDETGAAPWEVDLRGSVAFVVGDDANGSDGDRVAVGGAVAPLAVRAAVMMFEAKRQREVG